MLRYVLCIPNFSRTFIMKWCWILLQTFSVSNEMILWLLSFCLFLWWIAFAHLCETIPASLGRSLLDYGRWSFWCFLVFGLQVFYLKKFICVHQWNWSVILFVGSLCGLGIVVPLILKKELSDIPSLSLLRNNLGEYWPELFFGSLV